MIVLIPVSKFLVEYEVAEGSPYSKLHRLVLQAISEGITSKDGLENAFEVHPRLLIECLVTLIHESWVALGGTMEKQFVLTSAGKRALKGGHVPESVKISRKKTPIFLERVTGAVLPKGEIEPVSKKLLQDKQVWNYCVKLSSDITDNKLDEGQIQHLLPRRQGQRLRWVGPILMDSKDNHFIPVSVNLETEEIVNLPERLVSRLKPYIIEEAKLKASRFKKSDLQKLDSISRQTSYRPYFSAGRVRQQQVGWPVFWSADDLLFRLEQHSDLLSQVFSKAHSAILITSALVSGTRIESICQDVFSCLERGVDISILWGNEEELGSFDRLKKLAFEVKQKGFVGKIKFNRTPANCNAKIMLWDEEGVVCKGAVGTYDWLANTTNSLIGKNNICCTICLHHPAVLSSLAWCAAGLWDRIPSERLASVPDRWRRVAAELETIVGDLYDEISDLDDRPTIRVIRDHEHQALFKELVATSQTRLFITSTKLALAQAEVSGKLAVLQRHPDEFDFEVVYGSSILDDEQLDVLRQRVEQLGGHIQCLSDIHANVIVSDQTVCISSYDHLGQATPANNSIHEVGVVIDRIDPLPLISELLPKAVK